MPHDSIPSPALLTEAEIAEIEARVTNATPGPWQAHHRHIHYTPDDDEVFGLGLEVHGPPEAENRGQFARGADAQFIAHARDDIPRLIAHIRELHRMIGAPYADAPDTGAVAGEGRPVMKATITSLHIETENIREISELVPRPIRSGLTVQGVLRSDRAQLEFTRQLTADECAELEDWLSRVEERIKAELVTELREAPEDNHA